MEIGLVSSSKQKRSEAQKPAELYMASPYFRKARSYVEENHDAWYILSPKHHLLDPAGPPIEPYFEDTFSGTYRRDRHDWAETVFNQLQLKGLINEGNRFVFHTARQYHDLLAPLLEDERIETELPTEGLKLGETLAWYNERM